MRRELILSGVVAGVTLLAIFVLVLTLTLGLDPAVPLSVGEILLRMVPALLIASGAAALMALRSIDGFLEQFVGNIRRITNRLRLIQMGDYNVHIDYPREDEISPMVATINALTDSMTQTVRKITYEKRKTDYILDNMDSGLLLVDSKWTIQQCNAAACKYFACSHELVGSAFSDLCGDPTLAAAVKNALEEETGSVFDLDLMERSGVVASVRVNPIVGDWMGNATAGAASAIVIVTNVTQARKMEQMRSEFVANVSHELKTPITSIRGFAELLGSGFVRDPDQAKTYVDRIQQEAERMTNLIEDILRLSRLENSPAEAPAEPVDLRALSEDILCSLTPQITRKQLHCSVRGEATFEAVPEDMRQLLKNLIENAVKYNTEGSEVLVRLAGDARQCVISVSDTGIGIPLEHQSRIFERFYRVDKGRSKREGGTGLGLSIVKHLVARYRGQITLTSRPGAGTTIKILLPVGQRSLPGAQ